jgi:membrane-associated phospholipid phosphatase
LILVALLRFAPRDGHPAWRFVRHWYFFIGLPFLYGSVRYLNRLLTMRFFDGDIVRIEQGIFGVQPSQVLHELLPFAPLSEFLHLSYLLYLTLVPLVGFPLYFQRRWEAYREFAITALGTYLFCYLIFILIPVRGPFHFFGPLDPPPVGGFFASLTHGMLHGVSSVGTAFPSSHVAAAVAIWMISRRYQQWISKVVWVVAAGILVGTVYGGFHYAVDALGGLLIGVVAGWVGPRLHAGLRRVVG